MPTLAAASGFALPKLGGTALSAPDSTPIYNSQTVPLLSPTFNPDPNAAKGGGDITVLSSALLPQAGPDGTAADIEEWPASSQVSVYTVRAGDTLSGIAQMFGVTVNTIIWANNIQNGVIHEGDRLVILPITGVRHTVVKGDTLASLAKEFHADAGDIASYNGLDVNAQLVVGSTVLIPNGEISGTGPSSPSTSKSKSSVHRLTKAPNEPYLGGSGPDLGSYYAWPLDGGVITQGLHGWNAVDIGAPKGTPIYAAAAGTVIVANHSGGWNGGYGNYVVIEHDNGTQTLYAHMSKVLVAAGDTVAQGDTIGLVGMTGEATGPHLHFEVRGAKNPFADLSVGGAGY